MGQWEAILAEDSLDQPTLQPSSVTSQPRPEAVSWYTHSNQQNA